MKARAKSPVTLEFPDGNTFAIGPKWRTVPDRWKRNVRSAAIRSIVKIELVESDQR